METEELYELLTQEAQTYYAKQEAINPEQSQFLEDLYDLYKQIGDALYQASLMLNTAAQMEKNVVELHPEDYDSENWEGQEDDLADHLI